MRPEVLEALGQVLEVAQADPGRTYDEAVVVRALIEDARTSIAGLAGTTARQVLFTSSIAESINHAIWALARGGTIVASGAERSSVLEAARRTGTLDQVPLDGAGLLELDALDARLARGDVNLLCAQIANHETGVVQDVASLVELTRTHNVALHLDASVAFGHLEIDLGALDVEAITLSSELIGGPLGVCGLLVRRGSVLSPLVLGGAQERARRAGLENLLGIVGFGVAAEVLAAPGVIDVEQARAVAQIAALEEATLSVEGVSLVGDADQRAPHLFAVTVEGIEAEPILMGLDRAGISVHSGSACATEALEPSAVLAAMGLDAGHSLRLSVGWSTTAADIERFTERFGDVVARLRALRT